jgi:hypothetical protein
VDITCVTEHAFESGADVVYAVFVDCLSESVNLRDQGIKYENVVVRFPRRFLGDFNVGASMIPMIRNR